MIKNSYNLLFIVSIITFVLDQITKLIIQKFLPIGISYHPPYRIEIVENFFYFVHIGNPGAAWGFFQEFKELLIITSIIALIIIYLARSHFQLHEKPMQLAFGLLIGGIIGNLVDRIRMGHVIDFIDIHLPFSIPNIIPDGRWPAFNIADSAIVIGLITYTILSFISNKEKLN